MVIHTCFAEVLPQDSGKGEGKYSRRICSPPYTVSRDGVPGLIICFPSAGLTYGGDSASVRGKRNKCVYP